LVNNRAFQYGDGLFETMHAYSCEIQFFDLHIQRLQNGMNDLSINSNELTQKDNIHREINRLLQRNKHFKGTRVKLTIYRDSGGLFKPLANNAGFLIETKSLENNFYRINEKGLYIDVFKEMKKPINSLSKYKTCSSLLNVMAGIYAKKNNIDDCLILNENEEIIEGYHSNLFLVKNNILYTPPISSGCVMGIMRQQILNIAHDAGLIINDNAIIYENTLFEADEIFLTNAIEGIRWVLAYKNRRYFNKISKLLCDMLNTKTFPPK